MELNKDEYIESKKELENELIETKAIERVIRNYLSKEDLAEQILHYQPMFYDDSKIWWAWDLKNLKWKIFDETDILNFVNKLSFANTIKSTEKTEILESLRQASRNHRPKEMKKSWIQFKETIVDIETGKELKASPEYFVTNPIPYNLHEKRFVETPVMDRIFEEWVGKDYVKTLYQIISYCLIPNYPIHRIFCFIGEGMNGKSCFLELVRKFIGKDNCCSTELDTLLSSRFEVTRLHKKLVCQMGETNFNEMKKTSILKKLSGGDLIGFEYKNKNPFEEKNYAKILISTNNLPTTTDKTVGFYRRWMIIDFPNRFSEQKDILDEIPEEEYQALAVKILGILRDLLDIREFHKEGSIEDRQKKYEDHSDPLEKFLKEYTNLEDPNGYILKWEFEKVLNGWLEENRFRKMADKTIAKHLRERNIEDGKVTIDSWDDNNPGKKQVRSWLGIKWKEDNKDRKDT